MATIFTTMWVYWSLFDEVVRKCGRSGAWMGLDSLLAYLHEATFAQGRGRNTMTADEIMFVCTASATSSFFKKFNNRLTEC